MAVIGEDTDLICLLLHYVHLDTCKDIYFLSDKNKLSKNPKVWHILQAKGCLDAEISGAILALHAILGCDTTSRLHSIGKDRALHIFQPDIVERVKTH